jgi:hypothetical protein
VNPHPAADFGFETRDIVHHVPKISSVPNVPLRMKTKFSSGRRYTWQKQKNKRALTNHDKKNEEITNTRP